MQLLGLSIYRTWNATVGIQIDEGLLLDLLELERNDFVRHLKLFENDDDLEDWSR